MYALDPDLGSIRSDIDPEPILREHYGRWLQIMGLDREGLALRYGEMISTQVKIEFEIKEIEGYEFAFPSRIEYSLFIPSHIPIYKLLKKRIRVGLLLRTLEKIFNTLREGKN